MKRWISITFLSSIAGLAFANDLTEAARLAEKKDFGHAIPIYNKLAQNGNADAQEALGELYWYGDGVKRDEQIAEKYFRQSAMGGNVKGKEFLKLIADRTANREKILYYTSQFDGKEVQLSAFQCGTPVIPEVSKTNEEIKKVQNEFSAWTNCYNRFAENLTNSLPAGKIIPKDIERLMNEDEMDAATQRMDKVYAVAASDAKKTLNELMQRQEQWKKATEDFIVANNKAVEKQIAFQQEQDKQNQQNLMSAKTTGMGPPNMGGQTNGTPSGGKK
ncbi:tetratricopeptide repeat protein [Undibacterium oligocarboniphilum]|uniref:Sel1 repeat family protein n=1 Tax=Undibacterium oligocarboniphilum TaxID=666702 RepID=A0A850QJ90_9BURK|nr:sel1 repeat family protein [Undibacterium oligocarboniphilum]MBC3869827.1 sel1 repeat family protein [Undibacterium oligocarboniphilum]NVO77443.1 sel1 repeat family protein [Undibacterium oligocarboniphilum]